ncbi:MAG: FAD-dependent oxidoreductase [Bacteroidales bacterium]|jgi:all-trans-retinol 13,14-reductase|nr:FAD-dependent oxidoreductase [Bacteroidales bacterium]
MPKYDVVIIGSGLGGLLCGNILSKEGMNVCILEKQHQFGGNLQTFTRDGKIFDTGIHYVGGLSEGQNTHQYFKYFGIVDKLNLKRLDKNGFDKINFEGKTYSHAQGFNNFIETLANDFPAERNALKEYIKKIREISNHFPLYNLRPNLGLDNELQFFETSIGDLLNSITKNKTLQNVLAGNNMLYAGVQDKTPVGIHALITNSLIQSAYQFVDGSQQIVDLLIETIKNNGGTLMNNSEVQTLNVHNGKIESAILSNGEVIEADNFISTIHPALTMEMTDTKMLRKSYRTRISEIDETISVFVVYLSLKPNSFKYQNYNYYHFIDENVWSIPKYNPDKLLQDYLFLTSPTNNSSDYAETAIAMRHMRYDEVKQWEKSNTGKRDNDYEAFKKQKAEELINQIEMQYPNFRTSINKYYTSTPLTIKDYTGTKNGSMYGIMHDCNNPLKTKISPKTKIPNLLLSGQNVNIHGLLGVTIGSVLTCTELLGMEYLLKKINNA